MRTRDLESMEVNEVKTIEVGTEPVEAKRLNKLWATASWQVKKRTGQRYIMSLQMDQGLIYAVRVK